MDERRREELIERFGLDPVERGRQYSKGNRQKVAIVAALASGAPVGRPPVEVIRALVSSAADGRYQGMLVWNWSLTPDDRFGFSPDGTAGTYTAAGLAAVLRPLVP